MDDHDKTQDGKKKGNVFDIYAAKRRERRSGDGSASDDAGYYAFGTTMTEDNRGREEWLRMHGEIGGHYSSIDMIRYADIVRVYSPVPELACIMADSVIYTLEGQHLDAITMYIQDRMLRAIYLFDPTRYPEPDADDPVVLRMERQDIGAEEAVEDLDAETPGS